MLLTDETPNAKVVYKDTDKPVRFLDSLTVDGITYEKVFLLKPGETANIDFGLGEDVLYDIVECGTNTDVYAPVSINGNAAAGTDIEGHRNRKDYHTGYMSTRERARVNYVNHVIPEARRTLTIRKLVYNEEGVLLNVGEDDSVFDLRLYLGTEFETELSGADMYTYHILDPEGNYCRWDTELQTFVAIGEGRNQYSDLTAEEKASASFTTSMNGSISNLPAHFTVEVRELLAGTQFRVEERDNEIPDGYSLQGYELNGVPLGLTQPRGTMTENEDEHAVVYNHRGAGLRVKKVWSDQDYMTERDATWFALFIKDEDSLVPVEGSVRQLPYGESTVYWHFLTLPVPGTDLNDYIIREVTLDGTPTAAGDGTVTGYDSVTPIPEGGTAVLYGKQKGESVSSAFTYTVSYRTGSAAGANSTVREDTVTNSRPGITFRKQDWAGNALPGAVFTLRDDTDSLIGTFTSGADGWITDAFLRENTDYKLTEISAPQGYQGMQDVMTVRMSGGTVTVAGVNEESYTLTQGMNGENPVVAIRNRPYTLQVFKKDGDTHQALAGIHFSLHRQKTVNGVTTIDLTPEPGFEDLVSGADGRLPGIDATLPAGTYELREKQASGSGYMTLAHIRFTVSPTHTVTLGSVPEGVTLTLDINSEDGTAAYTMTVLNEWPELTLTKSVSGNFADFSQAFTFTLSVGGAQGETYAYTKGTETGTVANGGTFTLRDTESITLRLPAGREVNVKEDDGMNGAYRKTWTCVTGNTGTAGDDRLSVTLDQDTAYTIENHLDAVSPTDVSLDKAPYLLMLLAGIALLAPVRRKRKGGGCHG